MIKNKIELLAPAGSFDSLQAAINSGADAIYFGVEQLNMRAKSVDPFSISDIKKVASICKANKVKSYITLNTVMYDHDIQLLQNILSEVKKNGIAAVIASDFSVFQYCRQLNIPLHISTQANVSNVEALTFFSSFADCVVLARELTLKQVSQIAQEIKRKKIKGVSGELMKLEIFVHGALCMAISGKCYLSLHSQNASANRGACTQNCRHSYKVTDTETNEELLIENEYIMSAKDLCTIGVLDKVIDSGAKILKIEGRNKGADYVSVVTKCYREAIDSVENGSYSKTKILKWEEQLSTVYNRGFWEGYYLGHKLGEWTNNPGSSATEKKVYLGKGSKYYPKIKVGEFIIESGSVKKGDTLMLISAEHGMIKQQLENLMVNGMQAVEAGKGDKITIECATKVSPKDKLYKIVKSTNA